MILPNCRGEEEERRKFPMDGVRVWRHLIAFCLGSLLFSLITGSVFGQDRTEPRLTRNNDDVAKLVTGLGERNRDINERLGAILLLDGLAPIVDAASREAIADALIKMVQHEYEPYVVRHDATWVLVRMSSAEPTVRRKIADALLAIVEHEGPDPLRKEIAEALGWMKLDPDIIVPRLIRLVEDRHGQTIVRAEAAGALADIGAHTEVIADKLRLFIAENSSDEEWPVRSGAVLALSKVTPNPTDTLRFLIDLLGREHQLQTRLSIVQAMGVIAERLAKDDETRALPELENAEAAVRGSEFSQDRARPLVDAITKLRDVEHRGFWNSVGRWLQANRGSSAILSFYCLALVIGSLFLRFRPLWLLRINELLTPGASQGKGNGDTSFTLPAWAGKMKIPLRYVLLVGLFSYSDRVLDAWVAKYLRAVREQFNRKQTVADRSVYVMTPVEIMRPERQWVDLLTAAHLQADFAKDRVVVLISGEGGAGKTSLACQIAKWAMSDDDATRLCAHHWMLPVMIEYDLEVTNSKGGSSLIDAISGQLRALIALDHSIPHDLLVRLLARRRVLLIVDRFSELNESTRNMIRPGAGEFPVNALIITSRIDEPLDGIPRTTITPLRIEGTRLSSFMDRYLALRGKRDLFEDSEFFDACSRLSAIVGRRNVTVMLAKIYAEQVISSKGIAHGAEFPSTIPGLMLSYLNELNRSRLATEPDDRAVHRAVKVIAWECLRETYGPTAAPRDRVLTALADNGEWMLAYLEDRLKIIRTENPRHDRIEFTLDPLAEYLAALDVVERCREKEEQWLIFLTRGDHIANAPTATKSFLMAVLDCCVAMKQEITVPERIVAMLEARCSSAGIDLAA